MPSLPALPAKTSALRDSSAVNALYNKATREYLSRDFSAALATVDLSRAQQLSSKHRRRTFLLYLAILDSITGSNDHEIKQKLGRQATDLTDRLRSGAIWVEAEKYFNGVLPNEVAVATILSMTRHMTDPSKLQHQVESHLTSLDPDSPEHDSISEIYALHVLPRCDEWENAAIFVESCDLSDEKRQTWLMTLDEIQKAQEEQKQEAIRDAEEAKQAELEAKKLRKVRKTRASGSKRSAASINDSIGATGDLSGEQHKSGNVHDLLEPNSHEPVLAGPSAGSSGPLSVISQWTNVLTMRFSPRIVRILLFLAVLFGATGRRDIREKLQAAIRKVGSTIAAGFKVSYI